MAGKENPLHEVTQVFDEAIYGLRDAGMAGVSGTAAQCVERIRNKELLVGLNNPQFRIPSLTGFDLAEVPGATTPQYAPVIVLDVGKMLGTNQQTRQADLVRTLAVAGQYPYAGYERRYRQVYTDALDTQKEWLRETEAPPQQFDPRTKERTSLIRSLIGEPRFYTDTGFADWQKAIDEYKKSGRDPEALPLLDQLRDAKDHFLVMRQRFAQMNYRTAIQTQGMEYLKWSADKRAETTAYILMGSSIYARRPDQFN